MCGQLLPIGKAQLENIFIIAESSFRQNWSTLWRPLYRRSFSLTDNGKKEIKRLKSLKRSNIVRASFRTDRCKMNGLDGDRGKGKVHRIGLGVGKPERSKKQILKSNKQNVKKVSFNEEFIQHFSIFKKNSNLLKWKNTAFIMKVGWESIRNCYYNCYRKNSSEY